MEDFLRSVPDPHDAIFFDAFSEDCMSIKERFTFPQNNSQGANKSSEAENAFDSPKNVKRVNKATFADSPNKPLQQPKMRAAAPRDLNKQIGQNLDDHLA